MSLLSKSSFDKALEKATSQLLLDVDWDAILQICDCIRQEDVQPKYALNSIKKKITMENPHISLFALQVLESVVKNCGSLIHKEVATKEFMEFMKDQCKIRTDPVKSKLLELIQVWSHAFRNEPSYRIVQDTYNLMKLEEYSFPAMKEADAMFTAEKAPEWKDGDSCSRCRTSFSVVQRKHHCRNCGDVFCGKCSSKQSIIPRFGIEKEVRVCEACFNVLNDSSVTKKGNDSSSLPQEYLSSPLSKQSQAPPSQREQELKEKEDLELALALSQSEQESKAKSSLPAAYNYASQSNTSKSKPSTSTDHENPADPELAHYLNRSYWEQKSAETAKAPVSTTTPSAPSVITTENVMAPVKINEILQNGGTDIDEAQFLSALMGSVDIFVNRMKSNSMRGRSIANDTSVQSLFTAISNMHPQLLEYLQQQEEMRAHYEMLQDKLAQLRDAREALDALRDDYQEKRRRELEEQERQRQIMLARKLEIMRQKKHEYLEAQRQHALQKLQEQEREMQMRFEKQKQLTQMRQMQAYGYPQQLYNQAMGQMTVPANEGPQSAPPTGMYYNQAGNIPLGTYQPMPPDQPDLNYMPNGAPQYQGQMVSQQHLEQQPPGPQPPTAPTGYPGQNYIPGVQYQTPSAQQPYQTTYNMPNVPPQPGQPVYPQNIPPGGMVYQPPDQQHYQQQQQPQQQQQRPQQSKDVQLISFD